MRYGFISRKNPQTVEKHLEALKQYNLDKILIDDFTGELDDLFETLKTGDSLYMEEPPRDMPKFVAIYSFTRKNDISLYVRGEIVDVMPLVDMFNEYVKIETAKRLHLL